MRAYRHNTPYTAREKEKALQLWKHSSIEFVCHRYHCSERSLWRWKSRYDGTLQSLENGSCKPLSKNKKEQSDLEKKHILDMIRRFPGIGLNELYGKLRVKWDYHRNPTTLYRYLRKSGIKKLGAKRENYKAKSYDTPICLGEKWQLDVKFVPSECRAASILLDRRFYQYTVIDEASRQRFIYPYEDLCASSTIDFIKRAIKYFGYQPKVIQTDNGSEFTYTRQTKDEHLHPFDVFCNSVGIEHKTIKPRTPRHNGKVERSHRSDNERFYSKLKFYSYRDLLIQMQAYLRRSNNIPISTLTSFDGKIKWLTPMQKRAELLADFSIVS